MDLRDFIKYGGIDIFNGGCMSLLFGTIGVSISSSIAYPDAAKSSLSSSIVGLSVLGTIVVPARDDDNNINDTDMIIESMSLEELNELKSKIDEQEKKLKL